MAGKGGGRADRTSTAKSEATRARVLDAAARVLAREGYSGTKLTDVAREADIQAPAIYYYFASREDLIEEVAAAGANTLIDQVNEAIAALPADASPLDHIDALAEAHIRFTMTAPDYARAVLRNAEQFPDGIELRHVAVMQRYQRLWATQLREAQKAGLLDTTVDLAIARHLAIGALNSAMDWWAPGRSSVAKVVAQTRHLLRHGLGG
ncbi:TetR/AcrR family transcriptional regulator [Nocardioides sp. WS12]|uniref:TetR/AcrR family transcriptional regulator n=1 Tax=Nocardioides sp. WS12 TaxID=2486272 RepID=UPI0015F9908C|nr:TetR/AcrR family transcriptional regulator [Nocardioides sp. WS12]